MKLWRPPWTCCFVRDLLTSRLSTGEHRAKNGDRQVSDYDDTWATECNLTLSFRLQFDGEINPFMLFAKTLEICDFLKIVFVDF